MDDVRITKKFIPDNDHGDNTNDDAMDDVNENQGRIIEGSSQILFLSPFNLLVTPDTQPTLYDDLNATPPYENFNEHNFSQGCSPDQSLSQASQINQDQQLEHVKNIEISQHLSSSRFFV